MGTSVLNCQKNTFSPNSSATLSVDEFLKKYFDNEFGEACIYHNEPLKIPVAGKEMIKLKDDMDKIRRHKER